MNPLQSKLLEMLTWLSSYLNEKGLTYYVMGGTMLGAQTTSIQCILPASI